MDHTRTAWSGPAWPQRWHCPEVGDEALKKGTGKNGHGKGLMVVAVAHLPQLGTGIGGVGLKEEEEQEGPAGGGLGDPFFLLLQRREPDHGEIISLE